MAAAEEAAKGGVEGLESEEEEEEEEEEEQTATATAAGAGEWEGVATVDSLA